VQHRDAPKPVRRGGSMPVCRSERCPAE